MYEATRVANAILDAARKRNRTLTPLQLMKLVYIAHGFSLALNGRPLIDHPVEAWRYGPVIASVYHAAKMWGRDYISGHIPTTASNHGFKYPQGLDADALKIIDQVAEKWGHLSGGALSSWTHKPGSPWAKIYREGVTGLKIPDQMIKEYFQGLVKPASNG